jgi:NAD(P)-dependent dehydrogenase (short-subunit alcohol dehydrogenase family)
MRRRPAFELILRDLSSLRETHRVGRLEIAAAYPRLDLLINNASMYAARRQVTAEGNEAMLVVNHLAPYVLTDALEGALRAAVEFVNL